MGRLTDQVVVVTGAASGIGREVAIMAAEEGASVVLADISDAARGTLEAIEEAGGSALYHFTNITDEGSVKDLTRAARDHFGPISGVVNAAGVWFHESDRRITDLDIAAWNATLAVNLTGTYLIAKYCIPQMRDAGGGSIVNIASVAASRAQLGVGSAYTASKGGVLALSRLLAVELAPKNVRVNCISPGPIRTELTADLQDQYSVTTPLGRTGRPRDIAVAAIYFLSTESGFVTGLDHPVDGGISAKLSI